MIDKGDAGGVTRDEVPPKKNEIQERYKVQGRKFHNALIRNVEEGINFGTKMGLLISKYSEEKKMGTSGAGLLLEGATGANEAMRYVDFESPLSYLRKHLDILTTMGINESYVEKNGRFDLRNQEADIENSEYKGIKAMMVFAHNSKDGQTVLVGTGADKDGNLFYCFVSYKEEKFGEVVIRPLDLSDAVMVGEKINTFVDLLQSHNFKKNS